MKRWPPIRNPEIKQTHTAPPRRRARPHLPWRRCPRPGINHPAIPISQARAGAVSVFIRPLSTLLKLTSVDFQESGTRALNTLASIKVLLQPSLSELAHNLTSNFNGRRHDF